MTARWALKRALKWGVEWGMALSGAGLLYRGTSSFRNGFRILTYHKVSERPENSHTLKTSDFRDQMAFLSDHHPVMRLEDLVRGITAGPIPQPRALAVTFDDGYAEAATFVGEILERFRVPATFFVVTGVLDGAVKMPGGPFLTWDQTRLVAGAGFSIGSHTVSHRSLREMPLAAAEEELSHSLGRIADELGTRPRGLSYPYGTSRDFSPAVADLARSVGYEFATTAIHGLEHAGCNPYLLHRTTITAGDGLRTFRMILKGHLDPWALVDTWGYRFQRTYDA